MKSIFITILLFNFMFMVAQEKPKNDSLQFEQLPFNLLEKLNESDFIMKPRTDIEYYILSKKPDPIYDRELKYNKPNLLFEENNKSIFPKD